MKISISSNITAVFFAVAIGAFALQSNADNSSSSSAPSDNHLPPPSGGHPPMPPLEALQACSGKATGAVCSFNGREGAAIEGQCFGPPPRPEATTSSGHNDENRNDNTNSTLACVPSHDHRQPPQS